jgi:hypothetical protein
MKFAFDEVVGNECRIKGALCTVVPELIATDEIL